MNYTDCRLKRSGRDAQTTLQRQSRSSLTEAGIDRSHADAIAGAVATAADHGDPVTKTVLDAALIAVRTEITAAIATAEARIDRAMLVQTLAIVGGVVAILRLLG